MPVNSSNRPDQWLQNAASLAMSTLLARLDMDMHARPFFWIDIRQQPPQASHSYWDTSDIAGRFVDGLVLARRMTGRADGAEAEAMLRQFLWSQQDPGDGLFYNWEENSNANTEMSKYVPDADTATRQRHVDLFCQRSPLLAMTTLLADGDEAMRPRLQRMVSGLLAIAERNGDEIRFPTYRWAPVLKSEWFNGASVPEKWLGYRYALLTGLARYAEIGNDPAATELALGLARFYIRHGDVPMDGRFAANTHSGGVLPTTVGIARLGIWAGLPELIEWANRVYLWVRANTPAFGFLLDGLGLDGFFSRTCETCGLADLVHLALLLTEAGVGNSWGDIERVARNQLLENQLRDAATLRRLFPEISEPVLAMMHGGFECAAYPNRLLTWTGVEGCCIGGGLRALYLAWRATVTEDGEETRVNMGFSRATPTVEVIGHEPWRGRIDVRLHTARRLQIRLPEHAPLEQTRILVDGRDAPVVWRGRYAHFGQLQTGQIASMIYPLRETRQSYTIADQHYEGVWRGGTMVDIHPLGDGYPIYQRRPVLAREHSLDEQNLPWQTVVPAASRFLW
jgi:hypothetical protein